MLWSFVVATTLITLMPGPSLVTILMHAIDRGLGAALLTTLGVVAADAVLLVLAMSGLGALLYSSPLAFGLLKWLGIGYLVYLGVQQLRTPVGDRLHAGKQSDRPFMQGLGTTLLNPKIIGFLIVYFPQFLQHGRPVVPQLLLLGPVFLLVVFVTFAACAVGAKGLRRVLETQRGRHWVKQGSGVSLITFGVLAAVS